MFEITTKRTFPATHALSKDGTLIEEPHEHEWVCEVSFASEELDEAGMLADFRDVDRVIDSVLAPLTSKALHVAQEFSGTSASAENVAKHIFERLKEAFPERIARVQVWEDASHSATYYE